MTEDTILIRLSLAERHTLSDLLTTYICTRVADSIECAPSSADIAEAAEQGRRLALIQALVEEDEARLPAVDADAVRADLVLWALETDETVEGHDALIAEPDSTVMDARALRERSAVDYAHQCVCQRIVGQIDKARQAVA